MCIFVATNFDLTTGADDVSAPEDSSRILSAVSATVESIGAGSSGGSKAKTSDVGCTTRKQDTCYALLNATFADADNVADERDVIPNFDDDRLDKICR